MKLTKVLKGFFKMRGLLKGSKNIEVKQQEEEAIIERIATSEDLNDTIQWDYSIYGIESDCEYINLSPRLAKKAPKKKVRVVKFSDCIEARNHWVHVGEARYKGNDDIDQRELDLTSEGLILPKDLAYYLDLDKAPKTVLVDARKEGIKKLELIRIELEHNNTARYVYMVA